MSKAEAKVEKPEPVSIPDQWVMTPLGRGRRGADTVGPLDNEPRVSVLVEGYSAPHDFPVGEVTPIDPPKAESKITASGFQKTSVPTPMRGQHKQILARLPDKFREHDVEVALLQAIGDRKVKPVSSVPRRVGALIRQMLKKGWIEPQ